MVGKKSENRVEGLEKDFMSWQEGFQKEFELMREEHRLKEEARMKEKEQFQLELKEMKEMLKSLLISKENRRSGETSETTRPEDDDAVIKGKGLMETEEENQGSRDRRTEGFRQEPQKEDDRRRDQNRAHLFDEARFAREGEDAEEIPMGFGRPGDYRRDCRTRRIEMPIFNGEDPDGWIYCVERFFSVGRFNEAEKMELVALSLEKDALCWFRWVEGRRPVCYRVEFKDLLVQKFRPIHEGTQCQRLLLLYC